MKTPALVAAIIALTVVKVAAQENPFPLSAETLNSLCVVATKTPANTVAVTGCYSFIDGWQQGMRNALLSTEHGNTNAFVDDLTVPQIGRVFVAYMVRHPEMKKSSAGLVLSLAVVKEKLARPQ